MAKSKVITRDQFALQKVKILKDGGGMEVIHEITVSDGSVTNTEPRTHTPPIVPHPDFIDALNNLKAYLCDSVGMFDMKKVVNSDTLEFEQRRAAKALVDPIERFVNHRLSMVIVTGVAFSGEDKNEGCIITGTLTTATGGKIALNSPRIQFGRTVFGWEEDLENDCGKVCDEAYEYLYDDKKGQVSILDNEQFNGQTEMELDEEEGAEESGEETAGEETSGDETEAPSVDNLEKNLKKKAVNPKKEKPVKKKAPVPAKKKKETKLSKTAGKKKKK